MDIKYYNRISGKIENEKVYGDKAIEWLYKSSLGKRLSNLICQAPFSVLYGKFQDLTVSHLKVDPFIKKFDINMDDYLPEEGRKSLYPYSTFNQFFIRRFKPGKRPFVKESNQMAAFSEARYFGYESVHADETVPVKGVYLRPEEIIANMKWSETFKDGPLLLARLCPVDYHRYHYPDNGKIVEDYRVPGLLHSVNPLALKEKQDILITNERHVTIIETENFGKLAYVEVGATCVGKIVQSKKLVAGESFERGEEKGFFLFGGSTVIVIGEKGKWTPSQDIITNTKNGLETYLHLGMSVANKG